MLFPFMPCKMCLPHFSALLVCCVIPDMRGRVGSTRPHNSFFFFVATWLHQTIVFMLQVTFFVLETFFPLLFFPSLWSLPLDSKRTVGGTFSPLVVSILRPVRGRGSPSPLPEVCRVSHVFSGMPRGEESTCHRIWSKCRIRRWRNGRK